FELFSVQIDAPVSEIRGKALALSRKFSAERYSGISPDMSYVDVLKEINDLIRRSEEVLTDRLLRSAYNKQLEINIPSLEARIDAIFTALDISNDGRMMLHSNQFEEAVKRFQEAIEIHGEEPDHTINLIKAQLMLSKKTGSGDMPKMLEAILLVISANSMNISARLAKVAVLKALSRNDEAVAELKEILRLDPRNEDARTTLKLSSIKPVEKLQFRKRNDSIFRKMIDYLKG
ncbi:MAG: hypothetical protein FJ088_16170, partial [Deltaproteobacteria bacterium]|nr:hypothetical protein [Deltaproteobacteria bacterium]